MKTPLAFLTDTHELQEEEGTGWHVIIILSHLKSVNLQYLMLGCLDDGINELSTKSLMFQRQGQDGTSSSHPFTFRLSAKPGKAFPKVSSSNRPPLHLANVP